VQTTTTATLALKEWAAVAHALLDGRQTLLLRKGGIHEKSFDAAMAEGTDAFVLFPTVAHSHLERVRPEHRDVLARGAADVQEEAGTFTVRCGIRMIAAVPVRRPEGLEQVAGLHIWTSASVRQDRLEFRPRHLLHALVVQAVELPRPVVLERLDDYGGCRSWLELPVVWDGRSGRVVHGRERLAEDVERVRRAVT
jgi:hypothetical protein